MKLFTKMRDYIRRKHRQAHTQRTNRLLDLISDNERLKSLLLTLKNTLRDCTRKIDQLTAENHDLRDQVERLKRSNDAHKEATQKAYTRLNSMRTQLANARQLASSRLTKIQRIKSQLHKQQGR